MLDAIQKAAENSVRHTAIVFGVEISKYTLLLIGDFGVYVDRKTGKNLVPNAGQSKVERANNTSNIPTGKSANITVLKAERAGAIIKSAIKHVMRRTYGKQPTEKARRWTHGSECSQKVPSVAKAYQYRSLVSISYIHFISYGLPI